MWSFFRKRPPQPSSLLAELDSIPVVEFDRRLITQAVMDDLKQTILLIKDIPKSMRGGLYKEAVKYAPERNLHSLTQYIKNLRLNDVSAGRAAEISRFIANRTTSFIAKERQTSIGVMQAVWMYSGAPCGIAPDFVIDDLHCSANGQRYSVETGLLIGSRYVWPGREAGCKCVSRSAMKGFL